MRNLVVCCDGTWNTPDQKKNGLPIPTNVVKLFNSCVADGNQLKYYHPGVGTEGGWIERMLGGGLGAGLDKNIQSAYHWICRNYQTGDKVFMFGFSRGAYTVRSLGGFMIRCGLLNLDGLEPKDAWQRIDTAFTQGYRERKEKEAWSSGWGFSMDAEGNPPDIHFIGVWDTVGARGVPDDMVLLDLLIDDPVRYSFHDTTLSNRVHHAYHAVALDEVRASFAPTLWTADTARAADATTFEQRWFPGDHGDVGGGHVECGLSDAALKWMFDKADTQGLRLIPNLRNQLRPDHQAVLHDALDGIWKSMRTLPRAVPEFASNNVGSSLHASAWERHENPPISQAPYRPNRHITQDQAWNGSIYARDHWNASGVWLEAGVTYHFEASGEWIDLYNRCGPEGMDNGNFKLGDLIYRLSDLFVPFENAYKRLTGKPSADFRFTRRYEAFGWFALIGMVANQKDVDGGGTPPCGEVFLIGTLRDFTPERCGYLYCFANDAWNLYDNNRGSVTLSIQRV